MKLKELNDRIKKAKNNRELLAIIDKFLKDVITEIGDLKIKESETASGIFFSKDGNRMYTVLGKEILEHALSIPFDWRTGTYIGKIEWTQR